MTANDFDIDVSSVESAVLSGLVADGNGTPLGNKQPVLTTYIERVDIGLSSGETDQASIVTTTGLANVTFFVLDRDGNPLVGVPAAFLSLASTGSNNTITAVDTVTNRVGRFRWTFSSTTAEAKTLTLTALGRAITDTVAITVGAAGGLLTPILQVKYATTGTSDNVLMGVGETFPFNSRSGTGGEVLSAAGLDFPTTNCLRVPWTTFTFIRKNNFTALASGANRNHRWYFRCAWPNGTSDSQTHPMQDGNSATEANWMHLVYNLTDAWRPALWAGNGRQAYPNNNWTADALSLAKNATFRVEVQEVRVSASTYRLHIWIYNSSNVQVASDSDFYRTDSGSVLLSTNPLFSNMNEGTGTADGLVGFNAGCNDTGAEAGNFAYEGAFAVVGGLAEGVQIGAYGTVTGEEAP